MRINLKDRYGLARSSRTGMLHRTYEGEVEFEIRLARTGALVDVIRQHNIIKIFAKEIMAHRIPYQRVWDPNAQGGIGTWVDNGLNLDQYAPKYIVFGASFDANGLPLDAADVRFYSYDTVTQSYVPNTLDVGASYSGGLINAIPVSEPVRPLKRVERIYFEPSYQPAGVPLLQDDVRAINNVLVLETVLQQDEYNGFGLTPQDYFTITEVALVAAPEILSVGTCEVDPHSVFLSANNTPGMPLGTDTALSCSTTGTATITLVDATPIGLINLINEGDQIKIVSDVSVPGGGTINSPTLGQVSPYYLVLSKVLGGRDMVLDRTPVDYNNVPLTGLVGVYQDTFRIYSHRILTSPVKKSSDYEVTVRWRIIMD